MAPQSALSSSSTTTAALPTLSFGVVGIGRMGQQHALNLLRLIPNAKLSCVCSPAPADLEWAARELTVYGVGIYESFEEMITHNGLQAVIISSLTTLHYYHTVESLKRGIHALCEKPICGTEDELAHLIQLTTTNPSARLMVGFTRRFDASYAEAFSQIYPPSPSPSPTTTSLGRPLTLRFQSCEPYDPSPFMQRYLAACGGIFYDSVVHDIDLCLMFLRDRAIPRRAVAFGSATLHLQLRSAEEHTDLKGDADNAVGMVQFWGGEVAWFYNSRTAAGGMYDNASEVFCERGKVSINLVPRRGRVEMVVGDGRGVGARTVEGWYERYREAFVTEVGSFVEGVLGGGEMRVPMESVSAGLRIALALQESLRRGGVVVEFDGRGERVKEEAKL